MKLLLRLSIVLKARVEKSRMVVKNTTTLILLPFRCAVRQKLAPHNLQTVPIQKLGAMMGRSWWAFSRMGTAHSFQSSRNKKKKREGKAAKVRQWKHLAANYSIETRCIQKIFVAKDL